MFDTDFGFLKECKAQGLMVKVIMTNGITIMGVVESYDETSILVHKNKLIYKHSISMITVDYNVIFLKEEKKIINDKSIVNLKLEELSPALKVRTVNALKAEGIYTVLDLINCDRERPLNLLNNFGVKSFNEVSRVLSNYNIKIREE